MSNPSSTDPAPSHAAASGLASKGLQDSSQTADPNAKRIALAALLIYALFDLLLPLIPVRLHPPHSPAQFFEYLFALVIAPTAVFMVLQVWLSRSLVSLRPSAKSAVATVIISVVLWWMTLLFLHNSHHYSLIANVGIRLVRICLQSLLLTVGLTALGTLLARIVREPNVLLPVAVVAMPIDYVGAMTSIGFTHTVETHAPQIVAAVSVHVPSIGALHPISMIGPGDALFMAFFFAVVQNLRMNVRGTFVWMTVLLVITMLYVVLPFAFSVPVAALVPMGIAVIAANWRCFHLKRDEVFAMVYAAAILFAVVGVFYVVSHRYLISH